MKNTAKSLRRSVMAKFIMQTPEVKEKHKQSIVKRQSDPAYHDKRNSALQEKYKDPIWKENIDKANKAKPQDPKYRAAHQASYTPESNQRRIDSVRKTYKKTPMLGVNASRRSKAMWANPEHRTKMQQCVLTVVGAFESHAKAADAYGIGRGSFANKFKRENIKNPDLWKNISREEYELLKGI